MKPGHINLLFLFAAFAGVAIIILTCRRLLGY